MTLIPPNILICASRTGSSVEIYTDVCAAQWVTISGLNELNKEV